MVILIKVLPNAERNEWIGWFGDNILKVRIVGPKERSLEGLLEFLQQDLGILPESLKLLKRDQKNFFTFELPDVAWELFLTAIEK